MARVALIKLFNGLNLGMCQLSGELQRAGHDTRMIYFKQFRWRGVDEPDEGWEMIREYPLRQVGARGREFNWTCYRPVSNREMELLIETLRDFGPDLIGFSICTVPMELAEKITQALRQHFEVPIAWGGAGPTVEPERSIAHADVVCVGEGEEAIVELAAALDAGRDFSGIGNLWVRTKDGVIRNDKRPLLELESIAIPDFEPSRTIHIYDDARKVNRYPTELGRHYHIMTQRGCPFSCSFCIESKYQEMWGKSGSLRRRSVDVVMQELVEAKRKYGIQGVLFFDDVFTINPRWLKEFAPRYRAEVGLPFWCYTYPTTTKREDIEMLRDAGLKSVTMGIQSGSSDVLAQYNRPVASERAIRAAEDLLAAGVDVFFDLITRSEYETPANMENTLEFLLALPWQLKVLSFPHMVKYPGYGYTDKVRLRGLRLQVSDEAYAYYHRLFLLTRTPMPRDEIRAMHANELYRRQPELLEPYLPEQLPWHMLPEGSIDLAAFAEDLETNRRSEEERGTGRTAPALAESYGAPLMR